MLANNKSIKYDIDWELIEIYVDKKSGRSRTGRAAFNRMIEDAMAGKIDLIITKSVSRFGRNTVDVLSVLQELQLHGVDVFFELENIYASDPQSTLIISALEAFAQEQSEAHGESIRISLQRTLKNPKAKHYNRPCYGYQQDSNGELQILQSEAEVVRKIFQLYLDGHSVVSIINELYCAYIPSPTGKEKWSKGAINHLLTNEKYTGDVLTIKTYIKSYSFGKRMINRGEEAQYLANNHHEPIISRELFQAVQAEREARTNITYIDGKPVRKSSKYSSKKRLSEKNRSI